MFCSNEMASNEIPSPYKKCGMKLPNREEPLRGNNLVHKHRRNKDLPNDANSLKADFFFGLVTDFLIGEQFAT